MRQLLLLLATCATFTSASADDWQYRKQVSGNFSDIRDNITLSIENRGLVVNYVSHIADMLNRTGNDIGASKRIFEQAEIIEFCSASLSRRMMEADPHNIVLCPFAISIYSLPGEPGKVWISYRQPQGGAAKQVGELLSGIAAEAAQ
jgi:uncharacterized protein (DUF302 family)